MKVELNGLNMVAVAEATTILGTTKGGWIHASQRPCYEARTPAFFVMPSPLTEREVTNALGIQNDEASNKMMQSLTSLEVDELAAHLMQSGSFKQIVDQLGGAWEIRPLPKLNGKLHETNQPLTCRPVGPSGCRMLLHPIIEER